MEGYKISLLSVSNHRQFGIPYRLPHGESCHSNLYVADMLNSRIRKINLKTNIITTVADIGTPAT